MPAKVPQLVVLDYSSRAANLSWVAPADNQSPIARYTILYKPYRVTSWQTAGREQVYGTVSQARLSGLQPNTVYTIKIRLVEGGEESNDPSLAGPRTVSGPGRGVRSKQSKHLRRLRRVRPGISLCELWGRKVWRLSGR